jgi:hypothetical protein
LRERLDGQSCARVHDARRGGAPRGTALPVGDVASRYVRREGTRSRPTVLLRERPGADMSGLVNADKQHLVAAAQDGGVRRLIVERPSLRDPACDRAVEPTPALLARDAALPTAAREERHE